MHPLGIGCDLPAGVNVGTETFLRALTKDNLTVKSTPSPVSVRLDNFLQNWALPPGETNAASVVVPLTAATPPTTRSITVEYRMWANSGEGSARIEMTGINTDAKGNKIPMPLPMRPIYIAWNFDADTKTGSINISQRGEPFIE